MKSRIWALKGHFLRDPKFSLFIHHWGDSAKRACWNPESPLTKMVSEDGHLVETSPLTRPLRVGACVRLMFSGWRRMG